MGKRGKYNRVRTNPTTFKPGLTPWNKGVKGVCKAWNKGLTKSDPRVRKNVERMVRTVNAPSFIRPPTVVTPESHARRRDAKLGDKNPSKRPEVREKIRQSVLRLYKEHPEMLENRKHCGYNQHSKGYTSIERLIAAALTKRHIAYSHNVHIGRYFVDFVVMDKVIIECDGEYWHRHDNPARERYLHDQGYFTFHLGGKRITQSSDDCVDIVLRVMTALCCYGSTDTTIETTNIKAVAMEK